MTTARAEAWAGSSTVMADETATLLLRRLALWAIVVAKAVAGWGVQWDIQWHIRIGRDSFWIAPHVMTYAGVSGVVLLSFGVLAWDTWRRRGTRIAADEMTVMGITSTPGFHLAAWGIALTVLAAPIDDLWHRLFGLDVTLWSPPHLLGLLGSLINSAACLLIAREVSPAGGIAQRTALIVNAALLLGGFAIAVQPAFRFAYLYGGVAFHLYAILGALLFPLALLPAARLSGLRIAPLLVLVVSFVNSMIGLQIARAGFDLLQPVSVVEAEIVKDPDSPIAIAHAIARKNGQGAGERSLVMQLLALIPALVMTALDARRRAAIATLGYSVALLAVMTWSLARAPAYAPMVPALGATLIGLALTIVAAVTAATFARGLSLLLAGPRAAR